MKVEPCHYCLRHTYAPYPPKGFHRDQLMTKDHVVPRCRGGKQVVAACERCNRAKAADNYEDFLEFATYFLRGKKHRDASTTRWAFQIWLAGKLL